MQNKQAFFIIGSPGSGKDVVIRDIVSNYNIVEFASSQIDEMLSNDAAFKRATEEKRDALLERNSIIVTGNSFNLSFVLTKELLESIGYSSHLILVESELGIAVDRLKSRQNLKESLDRISIGNSNRESILGLFESKIIVDNNKFLDLTECRAFSSGILDELNFSSTLSLEDLQVNSLKKRLKPKSKIVPLDQVDTRGSMGGVWSLSPGCTSEALDYPITTTTPTASAPTDPRTSFVNPGMMSDQDKQDKEKQRTKGVLSKIKNINFKKVVPNGIE